eukprot:4658343-Amphidinium_carterae.2
MSCPELNMSHQSQVNNDSGSCGVSRKGSVALHVGIKVTSVPARVVVEWRWLDWNGEEVNVRLEKWSVQGGSRSPDSLRSWPGLDRTPP